MLNPKLVLKAYEISPFKNEHDLKSAYHYALAIEAGNGDYDDNDRKFYDYFDLNRESELERFMKESFHNYMTDHISSMINDCYFLHNTEKNEEQELIYDDIYDICTKIEDYLNFIKINEEATQTVEIFKIKIYKLALLLEVKLKEYASK